MRRGFLPILSESAPRYIMHGISIMAATEKAHPMMLSDPPRLLMYSERKDKKVVAEMLTRKMVERKTAKFLFLRRGRRLPRVSVSFFLAG